MRRRSVVYFVLTLISMPQQLSAVQTPPTATTADVDDEKSRRLDEVLSSLESALMIMKNEARNMNLDAIIGTRMVQGTPS